MNPSTFPATNRSTQKNIWKTTIKGNSSSKKPNLHQLTLYWTAPTKTLHFVLKKTSNGIKQVGRDYFYWHLSGIFCSKLLRSNFAKKNGDTSSVVQLWGLWTAQITVAGTSHVSHVRWSLDDPGFPLIHAKLVGRSNLLSLWFLDPPHLRKMNRSLGANKQKNISL